MAGIINKQVSNTSRIEWIDTIKGIVILLVVLGHKIQFGLGATVIEEALYYSDTVFRFIYSFHMPCLMLLSGYFLGFTIRKPGLWKNRVKTVLIPLLIWSMIPAGLSVVKALVTHSFTGVTLVNALHIIINCFWFLWAILFGSFINSVMTM